MNGAIPLTIKSYSKNEDGAIAIIFAISVFVLFLSAGLAVDYGRAVSLKSDAQAALDAALLSAASQGRAQDDDDDSNVADRAKKFFEENWKQTYGDETVNVDIQETSDGGLTGTATVNMPNRMWQIFGKKALDFKIESAVRMGEGSVEMVLALDTTGSMSGSKIEILKTSAKDLFASIFSVANAGERVLAGIVPFAQYANVGLANRNAPWISVPLNESTTEDYCYDKQELISSSNCRMETYTGTNDGQPYSYEYEVCDNVYGDPTPVCEPQTTTTTWYGCAGSRNYPLDTQDQNFDDQVPGVMNVSCGAEITPLSNDESILSSAIDSLSASGETYIPAGLNWGWRVLSEQEPFTGGVAYGAKKDGIPVRKILVLMTDGMTTKSPEYPDHDGTDTSVSNTLTGELCANIKATGIEIFTVAFEITDHDTKNLLRSCATDPSKYFDAGSGDELQTAFANIAKDVTPLHLAK